MSFMEIETQFGPYYLVESPNGNTLIPSELIGAIDESLQSGTNEDREEYLGHFADYVEHNILDFAENTTVTLKQGWYGRYSAPGYMNCTDWSRADTEEELIADLKSMYGDEEEEGSEEEEED